jgi:bile acid-coenzyme A ligase
MSDIQSTPLGVALHQLAQAKPDAPAITNEGRTITRGQLEKRTNRLAREFARRGVKAGSLVTIGLPNSIPFFEASLAAWKLGATPQPVSFRLPPRELAALIALADPALVVGLEPADNRPWLPPGFEPDESLEDGPLPPQIAPAWKAPTSGGSTGRPKLILAGTPGTLEAVTAAAPLLRMTPNPTGVLLATGPLYHNAPFMFSHIGLVLGYHVVLMSRFDPSVALELIERYRVSWMYAVPTMMQRILRLPEEERLGRDVSSLQTVYHMAAPCPIPVKRAWIEWLGPHKIMELYAGTEAQAITVINGLEWLTHPGSVGRVISGEMKILDAEGQELPPGQIGEIWMRSPEGVKTYRYLGAEPTAREGWETLGDMGYFDEEGYLYLADRKLDMILVGGSNVYPAEVEMALVEHPLVAGACVIGLPDEDYGNLVHAIIQTSPDSKLSEEELRQHLAERLLPYKIPRSFEFTTELLRDEADKIRRSALRQTRIEQRKALNNPGSDVSYKE